ncbi:IS3 family transposase [Paenibacillus sp. MER TA 81-3]
MILRFFRKGNRIIGHEKDIDDYIHFYNYERLQKKRNSLSPMEARAKAA